MNKYSKRALKTTATVGMSLAMVLSAAAPVMAIAVNPVDTCTSQTGATQTDACKTIFYDLTKAIEKVGLDALTVNDTATIGGVEKTSIIAAIIANRDGLSSQLNGSDYTTFRKWNDVATVIAADDLGTSDSKGMFSTDYFTSTTANTEKNGGLVNYYLSQVTSTAADSWSADNVKNNVTTRTDAIKAYEKMTKWTEDGYVDRLDDTLLERFEISYDALGDRVSEYMTSDEDVTNAFVAAWTTVLEQDLTGPSSSTLSFGKNATEFNDETGYTSGTTTRLDLNSKTAINKRISDIKDSKNYYRVKGETAVQDIIAEYEGLVGNITDLKDLLKSDSYVAYNKTKTKDAEETLRTTFKGFTSTETDLVKKSKALAKTLDLEQYEVLKALKEDVLDQAYNFETKKVGNIYVDKSGWVDGFTSANQTTVKNDLGNAEFLLELVDTKEGLFGFDVVLNYLEEFEAAWTAVTTDIAKVTPANIKSSDKAKLEAAEDAYYEMTANDGKFKGNLTKAQTKDLRRVKTTVEGLREAFDKLGTTEVAGWYDMGNGNWGYNNEDGTPAAYKWVAAGSDWYFVRDGKMARNTWLAANSTDWYYLGSDGKMATSVSVDGCWINSLGIYRR